MTAMTRARGETSGRTKRETPHAPSGMQPSSRTRCSVPMAPKSTVPVIPTMPNAGEAGAVVPTPADCQPEKKRGQLADQGQRPEEEVAGPQRDHEQRDHHGHDALASGAERRRADLAAEAV